jgi:predicted Zn-dependent peptidase
LSIKYHREKVSDGIYFTSLLDERLKTNTIIIHMLTKLEKETASLNAIVPVMLSDSNSTYTTFTEMNKKLSSLYGAVIKGAVSKTGDSQVMSLTSSCIADKYAFDKEPVTEELTDILIDCLISPYTINGIFEEKLFELKKQELLDDIEAEINDKRAYAIKRASLNIFENEPSCISAKGEKETAEAITAQKAFEQYRNLLKTVQFEIIFIGSTNPDNIKSKLFTALKSINRQYFGDNYSIKSPVKNTVREVKETLDVAQSKMVIAFKTDFDGLVTMKLMNAVFGGTPFSKLFLNVREKLSLCYYCSSGFNDKKGVLYVDSGVEHGNIEKAKAEILNQLEEVKNGNFSDEEIDNSKLSIINSWKSVNDNPRSIAEWYFNQSYSKTSFSPEDEIEKLKSVSREDVIKAAKTLKLDTVYVLTGKEANN